MPKTLARISTGLATLAIIATVFTACGAPPELIQDGRPTHAPTVDYKTAGRSWPTSTTQPAPTAAAPQAKEPPIRFPRPTAAHTVTPMPTATNRPMARPTRALVTPRPMPSPTPRPTAQPMPTYAPAQPLCTCVSHLDDAGTLFAIPNTVSDVFYEAIYAISMEDGKDTHVADVDSFGLEVDQWGLEPYEIEWDGCRMWMLAKGRLYTVDMQTGVARRGPTLSNNISRLAWDGDTMWGIDYKKSQLASVDLTWGKVRNVEPAKHPPSARMHRMGMAWADGVMYATNGVTRIDEVDLERGHLARLAYTNRIRAPEDQIKSIIWADGRLHVYTLNYGFHAVNDDRPSDGLFILMGPTDPFTGNRSSQVWMDFTWVPGDEGQC